MGSHSNSSPFVLGKEAAATIAAVASQPQKRSLAKRDRNQGSRAADFELHGTSYQEMEAHRFDHPKYIVIHIQFK